METLPALPIAEIPNDIKTVPGHPQKHFGGNSFLIEVKGVTEPYLGKFDPRRKLLWGWNCGWIYENANKRPYFPDGQPFIVTWNGLPPEGNGGEGIEGTSLK